jgi:growth factor-regulated tyrosine kinase substrate
MPQPIKVVEQSPPSIERIEVAATNGDEPNELDSFLNNLRSALEIFVNRMNSNKLRGRPIANDTSVQSLFLNITNMHSQLLQNINEQDEQRLQFEGMQDKLSQIRDARAALDALREEHQEKLRQEAEEAERVRQQQMAQKLEIMRKKKQEYLQYQRQIALQRIQEQEAAMKSMQQNKYWPQAGPPASIPYSHPQGHNPNGPPVYSVLPQHMPPQNSPAHMPQQYQPQAPQSVYQPPPENYAPYNMQNMSNAIPPHSQQQGPQMHAPNQHPAHNSQPTAMHVVQQPPANQHAPTHHQQPEMIQPGQPQYVPLEEPPKPVVSEQPLISFD